MSEPHVQEGRHLSGKGNAGHILVGVTSAQTCLVLAARLKALIEAGFRVSLVSAPGGLASHGSKIEGVSAHEIPMARAISLLGDAVTLVRLLRLHRRLRPDLVEFSTPKAGLLGSVAAWICRVPVRIYFLRGLRFETARPVKRCILLCSEKLAAACAHVVLVNSRSLGARASEAGVARESKIVLLAQGSSNGVDVGKFSPGFSKVREEHGIPADAPVIGFVGRLTKDKGIPELMEAFAEVLRVEPQCYLLLVGWFDASEDALGRDLRARVEGHPRIVCSGYVDNVAQYYRAMDLLVLPSWREGFPNAVLEAAASGVPVVATKCTGSRDAVVPGITGLLVPRGDSKAIAGAVLRILRNQGVRGEMANAARRWAVERFDQSRVLGEMVRYYQELLNGKGQRAMSNETATGFSPSQ